MTQGHRSLLDGFLLCGSVNLSSVLTLFLWPQPTWSNLGKGVPRPLLEPYCYHSYRQHHGGCLFKEWGGGSKSGPLCALLWRILTWCSRKQAQARHIHALTMSRPGIHCIETQCLVSVDILMYSLEPPISFSVP